MTPTNGNEHEEQGRGRAWERRGLLIGIIVAVVGVVVAVIGAGIGVWGVYDARDNREKLLQSQEQITQAITAKNSAEQQKSVAESRANQLSAENAKLQNVNFDRLLEQYAKHLGAIGKAASRYDELRKLPDTPDTVPQKAAAQRQLNDEVAAFTQFVAKWRAFAQTLGRILDGNVQQMDNARLLNNPDDIEDALRILQSQFPDLKQMLDEQLGQIASG